MSLNDALAAVRSWAADDTTSSNYQDGEVLDAIVEKLAKLSGADAGDTRSVFRQFGGDVSFGRDDAKAAIALYDWLVTVSSRPAAPSTAFQEGDRVTSPTRRALGQDFSQHIRTPFTQGTVVGLLRVFGEPRVAVKWDGDPSPNTDPCYQFGGWVHYTAELQLAARGLAVTGATVSLANTVEGRPVTAATLAAVKRQMAAGNKIPAIKALREATGCGLKAAKDFVEALPVEPAEPELVSQARRAASGSAMSRRLDQRFLKLLLSDERFRDLVLADNEDYSSDVDAARSVIKAAFGGTLFRGNDYTVLLRAYDIATGRIDPEAEARKARLQTEREEVARRLAQLDSELAAA